ncbi:hypothetical protein K458DRAFT_487474 [Lentithecium fluviatile CBS 122367]|uniref:Uncharacterized protein n=1 Tax=Lentithecium fluviatile CBS 122367 TaxID=1168545 RepID=A0A6G1J086_9PLEO|nr:hypothetical protein K458DRAFT_487474 [Lentithecium fluviatile CBS 122367]
MDGGTELKGTFRDCGPGNLPQIDFACQGIACNGFDQYPMGTIGDNGGRLEYKSTVRCEAYNSMYYGPMLFTQPDPNADHRVSQNQNITLPACKGLHIISDGTSSGTKVSGYQRTEEPECAPQEPQPSGQVTPGVQGPANVPVSAAGSEAASSSVPTGGYIWSGLGGSPSFTVAGETPTGTASATSTANPTELSQPEQYTGSAPRWRPKISVLLVSLLAFAVIFQGSAAHQTSPHFIGPDTQKRAVYKHRVRATSDNIRTFAEELGGYIGSKVSAVQEDGEVFADTLISETLSTICEGFFSGTVVEAFAPGVVDACVTAVYTANAAVAPELEFVSVFGASMFCNYMVSQAFPIAEEFSSEACSGLEDLILPPEEPIGSVPPTQQPSASVPTIPSASATESSASEPAITQPLTESKAPPVETGPADTQPVDTGPGTAPEEGPTQEPIGNTPSQSALPCGGADLMTDDNNCGTCGNKCGELQNCRNGRCGRRLSGGTDTTSEEVPPETEPPSSTPTPSITPTPSTSPTPPLPTLSSTPTRWLNTSSTSSTPTPTCTTTNFLSDPQNCGGCGLLCTRGPCVNGQCFGYPNLCYNFGGSCGKQDGCSCFQLYPDNGFSGVCANLTRAPDTCPLGPDECSPDTGNPCPEGMVCKQHTVEGCTPQYRCFNWQECSTPYTPTPPPSTTFFSETPSSTSTASTTPEPLATAGSWDFSVIPDDVSFVPFHTNPGGLYTENPAWLEKNEAGNVTINSACITNSALEFGPGPIKAGSPLSFSYGDGVLSDSCCLNLWSGEGCAGSDWHYFCEELLNPYGAVGFDVLSWAVRGCNSLYSP